MRATRRCCQLLITSWTRILSSVPSSGRIENYWVVTGWSATCLDVIEQENQDLVQSVSAKPALHAALSLCNNEVLFDAGWSVVKGRFDYLKRFVGGITSIFPSTTLVESDFSIIKIEKGDFRIFLTDLSIEGILRSKQYAMLDLL